MEYTNSQILEAIREHLHSDRDRGILAKRLIDGHTFERLGEEFGMSVRQIKNIVYKNEEILFRKLHKDCP
jgi:DNA-directed RNA polymerase sigma subunit (sigma70/sigma32)